MKVFKFRIIIGYEGEQNVFYIGESKTSHFIIDDNFLEGHIALDYMRGYINNDILHILIYDETEECFQFMTKMNGNLIQEETVIYLNSVIEEDQYCCIFCEEIQEQPEEISKYIEEAKAYCLCL